MRVKQKILRLVYPLFRYFKKHWSPSDSMRVNTGNVSPEVSFYSFTIGTNKGLIDFASLNGKLVLIVNTASGCGYTAQLKELQQLQEKFRDHLHIIGFPCNDFKEQEKLSDDAITEFCQSHYGVSFPLAEKTMVLRNHQQHPVYHWLTSRSENGWNDHQPTWNFSKYLIDTKGRLAAYFPPYFAPVDKEIVDTISKLAFE